ncbi:hypothetical protein ACMU_02635 [Actibacterium mucosum KCTC 23349]|uniref:Uncharacterized protein n=1 Tax=Actibacterium mucosum KCTC 23349 TaxID=1454373 RepID=A0A037ZMY1_9RHOB|nr:hypothetical protein ACMU_02635 [Actibacterium mucosum KCTC 23349]
MVSLFWIIVFVVCAGVASAGFGFLAYRPSASEGFHWVEVATTHAQASDTFGVRLYVWFHADDGQLLVASTKNGALMAHVQENACVELRRYVRSGKLMGRLAFPAQCNQ